VSRWRLAYRCIIYYRRGYEGSTPAIEPLTIKDRARDCAALLRYLTIYRAAAQLAPQAPLLFDQVGHHLPFLALQLAGRRQQHHLKCRGIDHETERHVATGTASMDVG
jgi:pimeloyl-ACP methyl ester carboxylesterase